MLTRVSCCAIYNETGQVLLAEKHPGKFEFPGGKCLSDESIFTCAKREIEEELRLKIEPFWTCSKTLTIQTSQGVFELVLVLCKVINYKGVLLTEHLSICWEHPNAINTSILLDTDKQLLLLNIDEFKSNR